MIQLFKGAIKRAFIYPIWLDISFRIWEKKGRTIPPLHAAKANIVTKYARHFSINILIDIYIYIGNMVFSINDIFNQIFSIKLDDKLYQKAKEKFAKYPIFISYKEIVHRCYQK